MSSLPCVTWRLFAIASLLAGCSGDQSNSAFTVTKIDPIAEGGVNVKLTTAGDFAEADESTLVAYVKIVAVHEATRQQRRVAEAEARAISREMTSRRELGKSRYLAVSTDPSVGPQGRKAAASVIVWDTQSESAVNSNVYDLNARPPSRQMLRFDTYSAEFIGNGL